MILAASVLRYSAKQTVDVIISQKSYKITTFLLLNRPLIQGRINASAGPGAVLNAGPLQTYNQVTTPTNCGLPKLRAQVLQHL